MTAVEIIAVFVLIPAGVYAVLGVLSMGGKLARKPRYRPGQPWEYPPVWWTANPVGSGLPLVDVQEAQGTTAAGGARGSW